MLDHFLNQLGNSEDCCFSESSRFGCNSLFKRGDLGIELFLGFFFYNTQHYIFNVTQKCAWLRWLLCVSS